MRPSRESAVTTRELLYTAVTRARQSAEIWATEASLRTTIQHRIRRASGLAARLAPPLSVESVLIFTE
ncbi:MAG: hypothetical protein ACRESR_04130 [Gammaproteobacteria bacterium]